MVEKPRGTAEYFSNLVELAEDMLAESDFKGVSLDVLCCYNNMRCGWTEEVSDLFFNPKSPEEVKLSEQMASVIERTLKGHLETAKPTSDYWEFIDLEHIAILLYRLGDKAPKEMIATARQLIEQSHKISSPELASYIAPFIVMLDGLENHSHETENK